jgi:superfamily II DNA helicase RecQ
VSCLWHIVIGLEPPGPIRLSSILADAVEDSSSLTPGFDLNRISSAAKLAADLITPSLEETVRKVLAEQTTSGSLEAFVKNALAEQAASLKKMFDIALEQQAKAYESRYCSLKDHLTGEIANSSRPPCSVPVYSSMSVDNSFPDESSHVAETVEHTYDRSPFALSQGIVLSPVPVLTGHNRNMGNDEAVEMQVDKPALLPIPTAGHLESSNIDVDSSLITDLQQLLKDPGARFKSVEQAYALHCIVHNRKQHSLNILPTGGGKTLLFVIPALRARTDGVYIAIIPNRSLLDNLKLRIQKFGVPVEEWRANEPPPGSKCSLVLISSDAVANESFGQMVQYLGSTSNLLAILLDEVHKYISESHYRPVLTAIHSTVKGRVPIHGLTATLQPGQEHKILSALRIPLNSARIIRARTDRPNLEYRVHKVNPQLTERDVKAVVRETVTDAMKADAGLKIGECGLIITRSIVQAEKVASLLGCLSYHSSMEPDTRAKVYEQWQIGKTAGVPGSGWLASTTLIDTGNDTANLKYTAYCEAPYHFESFLQGAGRTAREGQHGTVTVFFAKYTDGTGSVDREFVGIDQLKEYLTNTKSCRRQLITKYSDGIGVTCSATGVAPCDVCQGQMTNSRTFTSEEANENTATSAAAETYGIGSVEEVYTRYTEESAKLEIDIENLRILKTTIITDDFCPFEYISIGKLAKHSTKDCNMLGADGNRLFSGMSQFQSSVSWPTGFTCWKCWFPFGSKCPKLHPDGDWLHRKNGSAELADRTKEFVAGCLYAIFSLSKLREKLEVSDLKDIPISQEDFIDHIVKPAANSTLTIAMVMIARCIGFNKKHSS